MSTKLNHILLIDRQLQVLFRTPKYYLFPHTKLHHHQSRSHLSTKIKKALLNPSYPRFPRYHSRPPNRPRHRLSPKAHAIRLDRQLRCLKLSRPPSPRPEFSGNHCMQQTNATNFIGINFGTGDPQHCECGLSYFETNFIVMLCNRTNLMNQI